MKEYKLIPKNGKGAAWYTEKSEIFKSGLIKATDKDGFETLVYIENYIIEK